VSDPQRNWAPSIEERVLLVQTGETGTVLRLAPTEWGLLCDIQFDAGPDDSGPGPRRVHASTELRPLQAPS
jgi:hypothetical protein